MVPGPGKGYVVIRTVRLRWCPRAFLVAVQLKAPLFRSLPHSVCCYPVWQRFVRGGLESKEWHECNERRRAAKSERFLRGIKEEVSILSIEIEPSQFGTGLSTAITLRPRKER